MLTYKQWRWINMGLDRFLVQSSLEVIFKRNTRKNSCNHFLSSMHLSQWINISPIWSLLEWRSVFEHSTLPLRLAKTQFWQRCRFLHTDRCGHGCSSCCLHSWILYLIDTKCGINYLYRSSHWLHYNFEVKVKMVFIYPGQESRRESQCIENR